MRSAFKYLVCGTAAFVLALTAMAVIPPDGLAGPGLYGHMYRPAYPNIVRLTGSLYAPEGVAERGGGNAFKVLVKDRQWIFHIDEARRMNPPGLGVTILRHLVPAEFRFIGPGELTGLLWDAGIEGKTISVMGELYIASRRLRLMAVDEKVGETE